MTHSRRRPVTRWLLVFLLLAAGAYLGYRAAEPSNQLASLIPVSVAGYKRLLVLAPHSDDETLGAGGMIRAAQSAGLDVRVVIATNGDGYLFATMEDFRRAYPRPADFIRMGDARQQESLNALRLLGVPAANVSFLSYPDRGTPALWSDHWLASEPYRSPYTEATHSPYAITYNPEAIYAGASLLGDLRAVIDGYHPDLIVYPHPADVHPDHWGLSAFTRLALASVERDEPDYQPAALAYLVHRPDFPEPRGLRLDSSLLPPAALAQIEPDWYRFDLLPGDVRLKYNAIQQYRSQLPLLRDLLMSFARRNELFAVPKAAALPTLVAGTPDDPSTWRDAAGAVIGPVQRDPQRDFFTRQLSAESDLIAVFAARSSDGNLNLCSQVRGAATPVMVYTLRVKAISASGVLSHGARNHERPPGWHVPKLTKAYICDAVNLIELGNPWLVFVGADVEEIGTGIIDQVAWQAVYIGSRTEAWP